MANESRHQVLRPEVPVLLQFLDKRVELSDLGFGISGKVLPVVFFDSGAGEIFWQVYEIGFGGVLHVEECAELFPA